MTEIKEFIRDKNGLRGVLVGFKTGNNVYIGWSVCSPKDKFDKKLGYNIAAARIYTCKDKAVTNPVYFNPTNTFIGRLPKFIYNDLLRFNNRCKRYFKSEKVYIVLSRYNKIWVV